MTHAKLMIPTKPDDIIGPDRFGPSLWQGLHYITLGYPDNPTEEQKQKYKTFFLLLRDTLPCSICAQHYTYNLTKMPLTEEALRTRENLVKWLIDFHNVVNEMKGKPTIEYSKARRMIDTDFHCKNNILMNPMNTVYLLVGILAILIIIALVYKKK